MKECKNCKKEIDKPEGARYPRNCRRCHYLYRKILDGIGFGIVFTVAGISFFLLLFSSLFVFVSPIWVLIIIFSVIFFCIGILGILSLNKNLRKYYARRKGQDL
jgi:hypothetical protein